MPELSEELQDKKIIDFTDEELIQAGFMGDGAPESVKDAVRQIKKDPEHLGFIDGYVLNVTKEEALKPPSLHNLGPPFTVVRIYSDSALTVVPPDLICEFEKQNYYTGLSSSVHPPLLYYRTNLDTAPFPKPPPGTYSFKVANKIANGPFDPVLTRSLWGTTVGPAIIDRVLDARGIKYRSLSGVRFTTLDEAGGGTRGPLVIWIETHRGTTTAQAARDASPDILRILEDHGVIGAVVEWYESVPGLGL